MVKRIDKYGSTQANQGSGSPPPREQRSIAEPQQPAAGVSRQSSVTKVSHTLSIALAERLEEFAFFQRVSESAVIEHALSAFFAQSDDDAKLGEQLRSGGAGRRRKR